jgi:hypothetical protein
VLLLQKVLNKKQSDILVDCLLTCESFIQQQPHARLQFCSTGYTEAIVSLLLVQKEVSVIEHAVRFISSLIGYSEGCHAVKQSSIIQVLADKYIHLDTCPLSVVTLSLWIINKFVKQLQPNGKSLVVVFTKKGDRIIVLVDYRAYDTTDQTVQ